jgi:branched-subunit amino acid aminotransferase/4-amino-4-deoxychorismate lyase
MPDRVVWVDGRLMRGGEATLSFFDRGAHDGEGVFETFRVHHGRVFRWERHLERLVLAAAELGFPVAPDPGLLATALAQVLDANRLEDAVARITMTRGVPGGRPTRGGVWVEAEPLAARLWEGTRRLAGRAIVSRRPFSPGALGAYKTTSRLAYHLAREEARAARVDEAILADAGGRVLEGAVSNVFVVSGGRLVTPSLTLGILPGITRAAVLELARAAALVVEERAVTGAELLDAHEVFLTNAVQGVVPVVALDGRPVPGRETGLDLAQRLSEAAGRGSTRD